MDNINGKRVSGFKEIKNYICEACSRETCQWVFCVYFVVVILICGGCGLWESFVITNVPSPLMACNTIALSVASAACVDLIFARNNRPLLALAILVGVLIIVFHFLSMHYVKTLLLSWPCAIAAWLLAHFTWWIVNAHNPNLVDVDPQDPSGGATGKPLGGKGNYKGLKV